MPVAQGTDRDLQQSVHDGGVGAGGAQMVDQDDKTVANHGRAQLFEGAR